jgi:hypothetical protein
VGMKEWRVREGECLSSIAYAHGFFWQTLWEHPANAELKQKRVDARILLPGDVVRIPEREAKSVRAATGRRHRFRVRGVPERLLLQILENGVARANAPYVLTIDGVEQKGTTDGEGKLEHFVMPDARSGTLTFVDAEGNEAAAYTLLLRHLDPAEEPSGVRERLMNLGFLGDDAEGEELMPLALQEFQRVQGLPVTGTADESTVSALVAAHGC